MPYEPLHLDWPGLLNARDLGGLPTPDGPVRERALIRTESLTRLAPDGPALVREAGVSRVIDLRRDGESSTPHPFADDPAYLNLAVEDPADDKSRESMLALYLDMLDTRPDLFAAAVAAVADAPAGAVLVHCAAGKDRTGLVVALVLSAVGVADDLVAADYALTEERTAEAVERWLSAYDEEERAALRAFQATPPENMRAVLDHLDRRYAGAAGYLRAGGLDEATLDRLRDRLVAR